MALRQTEIALDTVSQNSGMATTLTVSAFTEHWLLQLGWATVEFIFSEKVKFTLKVKTIRWFTDFTKKD